MSESNKKPGLENEPLESESNTNEIDMNELEKVSGGSLKDVPRDVPQPISPGTKNNI